MNTIKERYGNWALITGASSGIGEEFARQLAKKGLNLFLVARRKKILNNLAKELMGRYRIQVQTIQVDLAKDDFLKKIIAETKDNNIGLLVNNAGREDSDHFLKIPVSKHLQTLHLNTRAPLILVHHFGGKMCERKQGGIINMASIVAFQGVPSIANYAATKAYNLIFSEGIGSEFKKYQIDVLAVAPGFTQTNLAASYNFKGMPVKPLPVNFVVKKALDELGNSRISIPGMINKFLYYSGKFFFPRKLNTQSFGSVFKYILRGKL